MNIELEKKDIDAIALSVAEILKPFISHNGKTNADIIFDVCGVAEYLKVKKQWIYEKVHVKKIPFYKIGKYPRFRLSKIDEWLNQNEHGNNYKEADSLRRKLT